MRYIVLFSKYSFYPLSLVVFFALFMAFIFPHYASRRLELLTVENCLLCKLELGGLRYSLLSPSHVTFERVHFTDGEPGGLEIDTQAAQVYLEFSWTALLHKRIEIFHLVAQSPVLKVTFGEKPPLIDVFSLRRGLKYTFSVADFEAHDGELQLQKKQPLLVVRKIELHTSAWGTASEAKIVNIKGGGQLAESGNWSADFNTANFLQPNALDGQIVWSDQNLTDLTPLFRNLAGAETSGQLVRLHARFQGDDHQLRAQVKADYRDFKLEAPKSASGNETLGFLQTLNASLNSSSNHAHRGIATAKESETETAKQVRTERNRREAFPHFLLRSFMAAAE